MATEWFCSRVGHKYGPVSFEQLQRLAAARRFLPSDSVWADGMAAWAKASTIAGLFPVEPADHSEPGHDTANASEPLGRATRRPLSRHRVLVLSAIAAAALLSGVIGFAVSGGTHKKEAAPRIAPVAVAISTDSIASPPPATAPSAAREEIHKIVIAAPVIQPAATPPVAAPMTLTATPAAHPPATLPATPTAPPPPQQAPGPIVQRDAPVQQDVARNPAPAPPVQPISFSDFARQTNGMQATKDSTAAAPAVETVRSNPTPVAPARSSK